MPCYCYATKTHIRTTRSLISQPSSAVKGADKSEQQSHHSMFEQIKLVDHTRTTVHDHPQLSLKCRQPNRISFDVFHRCFCKVATRVCETLAQFTTAKIQDCANVSSNSSQSENMQRGWRTPRVDSLKLDELHKN